MTAPASQRACAQLNCRMQLCSESSQFSSWPSPSPREAEVRCTLLPGAHVAGKAAAPRAKLMVLPRLRCSLGMADPGFAGLCPAKFQGRLVSTSYTLSCSQPPVVLAHLDPAPMLSSTLEERGAQDARLERHAAGEKFSESTCRSLIRCTASAGPNQLVMHRALACWRRLHRANLRHQAQAFGRASSVSISIGIASRCSASRSKLDRQ
ncbi:hypothetical protein L1887_42043 [Cichorium endivia]|nr:hypothetical protein L1887_42043 [Cichorium endivia]